MTSGPASGRRPLVRGDVVLVHFPFTDLSGLKLRPAIIVGRVEDDDVIVAFMTSKRLEGRGTPPSAHALLPEDPEFPMTGLRGPGLIRLDKLATVHRRLLERRLGRIGARTERAIADGLRYVFEL